MGTKGDCSGGGLSWRGILVLEGVAPKFGFGDFALASDNKVLICAVYDNVVLVETNFTASMAESSNADKVV